MKSLFGASWKTSLGGLISALGGILSQVEEPSWVKTIGQILLALGTTVIGLSARDNSVTSQQAQSDPK